MTRAFSGRARIELFLRQDGHCAQCGADLEADWEADHVVPYSAGGATETWNGRALCRSCNRTKGARMSLHRWQVEAIERYFHTETPDFLLVATPGAGKTRVAAEITQRRQVAGQVEKVVVVVPTEYLKKQWAESLHRVGIELDPAFANRNVVPASDYHGVAVTYAQVASSPHVFARLVTKRPTLVILDEIHHCGDEKSWGDAIRSAFGGAMGRLLLSGTPFRADNDAIPFVRYVDGAGVADFNYGYADALRDQIVRAVWFPARGSRSEWISRDGQRLTATFEDLLEEKEASERLRTTIAADGEWFTGVIREAHEKLMELRQDDHDAGGLVIAADQFHAQRIAHAMEAIVGVRPVLAISDEPKASELIEHFATSRDPWIVAVKMVSEGIDIPRLRVGVYATNVRAPLFFNQAVGRIIRGDDANPTAWFYIPDDPTLRDHAQRIREDRDIALEESTERVLEAFDAEQRDRAVSLFAPLSSSLENRGTIAFEATLSPEELRAAQILKSRDPRTAWLADEVVAVLIRNQGPLPATEPPARPEPPKHRTKDTLRSQNQKRVSQLSARYNTEPRFINADLNRLIGVKSVGDATEDQLNRRLRIATDWLAEPEHFRVRRSS